MQRAHVQSLVRGQRSHMPCDKKNFFLIKKKNKKMGSKWRVDGSGQDRKKGTRPDQERSSRGETEEGREECVPRSLSSMPFTRRTASCQG